MSRSEIICGYVGLTDAAPLIIAHELGFAQEEGFALRLVKQPSWSTLRDMLAFGQIDAAQMLSPLPVAMSLGLGGVAAEVDALMVMSLNGETIGVAPRLADEMRSSGWDGRMQTPKATARALQATRGAALRFGVPFPFSMHALLVDYWLNGAIPRGARRIEITTVPPSLMAAALAAGEIDAFCVGEPWGSLSVEQGQGELVLSGSAIWRAAPEKVLAARRDWAEATPKMTGALMRAVARAARWLDQPDNRAMAGEILSRSAYLGLPAHVLDRALMGRLLSATGGGEEQVDGFLRFFGGAATFPWRSQAAWIGERLAQQTGVPREQAVSVARACFRSDLYRDHLADTGIDMPGASDKLEGTLGAPEPVASARGTLILGPDSFFDGQIFDPLRK